MHGMNRFLIVPLLPILLSAANLFTITDRHGRVIQSKQLRPTHNASLAQKATEYSLQAIYDELHRAENLARAAEAAKTAAQKIARARTAAKKKAKTYQMSEKEKQQLLAYAKYFKGGKYVWGGTSPEGFDCSGYVQYLYKKHHISLPRTAYAQSKQGITVDKKDLKKGDLLFFLTDPARGIPVTHVGIYLGNGRFIHAASKKKGIIISPIDQGYYARKFVTAKRILTQGDS
jgi:cell wall-associated NlpC family hydrolase